MSRGKDEIVVGCQQHQVVTNAQLRDYRVDRADLQAGAAATIAQVRSVDVIQPVRSQERQRRKTVDDVLSRLRTGKSLQQFLQDQTRDHNGFTTFERVAQYANLRGGRNLVSAERERPDARIDEQGHRRERSAL
jgi:hypothetical protein